MNCGNLKFFKRGNTIPGDIHSMCLALEASVQGMSYHKMSYTEAFVAYAPKDYAMEGNIKAVFVYFSDGFAKSEAQNLEDSLVFEKKLIYAGINRYGSENLKLVINGKNRQQVAFYVCDCGFTDVASFGSLVALVNHKHEIVSAALNLNNNVGDETSIKIALPVHVSRRLFELVDRPREVSSTLTIGYYVKDVAVLEYDPINEIVAPEGTPFNVDAFPGHFTFHTHPVQSYISQSIFSNWPSGTDISGLITLATRASIDNPFPLAHFVASIEGLWVVYLSVSLQRMIHGLRGSQCLELVSRAIKSTFEQHSELITNPDPRAKQHFSDLVENSKISDMIQFISENTRRDLTDCNMSAWEDGPLLSVRLFEWSDLASQDFYHFSIAYVVNRDYGAPPFISPNFLVHCEGQESSLTTAVGSLTNDTRSI